MGKKTIQLRAVVGPNGRTCEHLREEDTIVPAKAGRFDMGRGKLPPIVHICTANIPACVDAARAYSDGAGLKWKMHPVIEDLGSIKILSQLETDAWFDGVRANQSALVAALGAHGSIKCGIDWVLPADMAFLQAASEAGDADHMIIFAPPALIQMIVWSQLGTPDLEEGNPKGSPLMKPLKLMEGYVIITDDDRPDRTDFGMILVEG